MAAAGEGTGRGRGSRFTDKQSIVGDLTMTTENRNSEDMTAGCLVHLLSIVVSIPLFGFTLMTLWAWFMVPTYGLPELSFGEALGTGLVVSFLAKSAQDPDPQKTQLQLATHSLVRGVCRALFALGFGFLYLKLFM